MKKEAASQQTQPTTNNTNEYTDTDTVPMDLSELNG